MSCIKKLKSPVLLSGLLFALIALGGCQTAATPEQITLSFWQAMAEGDIESAKRYATEETRALVGKQQKLIDSSLSTGKTTITGEKAMVDTTIKVASNDNTLSFKTVLQKQQDQWKVDYQKTLNNFSGLPFGDLFQNLKEIGDIINKELEDQIPLLENQIRSFSNDLVKQLEELKKQLEKSRPSPSAPEQEKPYSGTI